MGKAFTKVRKYKISYKRDGYSVTKESKLNRTKHCLMPDCYNKPRHYGYCFTHFPKIK